MSRTRGGYYGEASNTREGCPECGAEIGALIERCSWCGWEPEDRR